LAQVDVPPLPDRRLGTTCALTVDILPRCAGGETIEERCRGRAR
jgi:hypothetical protein